VLGQAFGIPGITVDTHVKRVSQRLGFTSESDPVKIEFELNNVWPKDYWNDLSTTLILHGRHTCNAQKPKCSICILSQLCPKKGVTKCA
jgi:Predicted EndoIII-related endonuclease